MVKGIDALNRFFGKVSQWLCLALVLLTAQQVIARYFFSGGSIGLQELEWHLLGLIFLFSAANTLREDGHVRVDLIYGRISEKRKAMIDAFGIVFFLFPCCAVLIVSGIEYAYQAASFSNPYPPDYYTKALAGADSFLYSIISPIEAFLRETILIGEISSDPGGLEALWIIKAAIPFGFILVFLQGVALLIEKLQTIFKKGR